jgi:F0F1-type ATP synthase gamma subunit
LIIAISSNRGLAGAFNSSIIKRTWSLINNEYQGCSVTVLPVGKKVQDAFKRTQHIIMGNDLLIDHHCIKHLHQSFTTEAFPYQESDTSFDVFVVRRVE